MLHEQGEVCDPGSMGALLFATHCVLYAFGLHGVPWVGKGV